MTDESRKTYEFGAVTLASGDAVTLHTGSRTDTATDIYWSRPGAVRNNGGDTVTVRNAPGDVIVERSY